jgi:hypothetical protein
MKVVWVEVLTIAVLVVAPAIRGRILSVLIVPGIGGLVCVWACYCPNEARAPLEKLVSNRKTIIPVVPVDGLPIANWAILVHAAGLIICARGTRRALPAAVRNQPKYRIAGGL